MSFLQRLGLWLLFLAAFLAALISGIGGCVMLVSDNNLGWLFVVIAVVLVGVGATLRRMWLEGRKR